MTETYTPWVEAMYAIIAKTIATERERCAKVVESWPLPESTIEQRVACFNIAAKIRSGHD